MATKPIRNHHWAVHKPLTGLKVVRKPGWDYKDQDEGAEYGIIVEHDKGISRDWHIIVWIALNGTVTRWATYVPKKDLLHYDIGKVYDWARTQCIIKPNGKQGRSFFDVYHTEVLIELYYANHPEELEIPQNVLDQWQLK